MTTSFRERLIREFGVAGFWLKDRVEKDGWHWTSNCLRELVRARTGLGFSNTVSPEILDELAKRYPELKPYIDGSRRKSPQGALSLWP